ncbi:MAG: serine/threonine protein kinase [Planctomycetaceae bacterium]|nr:serine/threonine protein kinase [Planctomycetaceae bacterium]
MTVESEEARLTDLLIRWEELRERGGSIPVKELCAGHPELADALQRRVEVLQAMDSLLGPTRIPGEDSTADLQEPWSPDAGASVRRSASCSSTYCNFRFHAAGGLGEVFMAHGEDLHRDVALKFVKPQIALDPDSQRRFLQEAEVTGRLEHPGIVPVYSLGRDDQGHPCYAMRFIRGRTLEEAIGEFHKGAAARGDSVEQSHALRGLIRRLEMVCNTIAYAHSRGVSHCDIKPKNIMLGKYDETLVVDWGLARPFQRRQEDRARGEETLVPSSGENGSGTPVEGVVGTPAYMSPEQSEGRWDLIGPASDIYALGVTLYAILTGRPPFSGRRVLDVLDAVRRGDFPPPLQVRPDVPRALDAICRKAMALKAEDRYATALELADDLERWLADEPVTAYREPLAVRLARWGRRHRTLVAGATALLVMAAAAMTVTTVLVERQKAEVVRQKILADQQHALAETNFRLAHDAVDRMLTQVGAVELSDVPHMERVRRSLLEEARQFYLTFLKQKNADPAIRQETARAHGRLGDIQEMFSDYVEAERSYQQAIQLQKALVDRSPARADYGLDLARSLTSLGVLLKKANRFQESETTLRAALALRERLAAAPSGDPGPQQALADSRYQLATLLARLPGRLAEDEQTFRAALALQGKLVATARDKPEYRRDLARYLNNWGMLLEATGRLEDAEDAYREAMTIQEALVSEAPTVAGRRWQLARTSSNLGVLLAATRRPREAEAAALRARELLATLAAEFPNVPTYTQELAATYNNLGLFWKTGTPAKAEDAFQRALALLEELAAHFPNMPDHRQRLALTYLNLGTLLEASDPLEAERACRKALDLQDRLVADFPRIPEYQDALGYTLYSLSYLAQRRGEFAGARRRLDQAIRHQRAALAANPRNDSYRLHLRDSLGMLAETLVQIGAHAEAADAVEEMPRLVPDALRDYLTAAAFLVRCMPLAASDQRRTDVDRRACAEAYAQRAVRQLRRAIDRGLLRDAKTLDWEMFAPVRDRDDLKELRGLLEDRGKIRLG